MGLVCSNAGFLGFCDVSISSTGDDFSEDDNVLYLCVMSLAGVLISRRGCSGDVWGFILLGRFCRQSEIWC